MRGVVVKRLRKEIREATNVQPTKLMGRVQKWGKDKEGNNVPARMQAVNVGYRAMVQQAKKAYKA